MSWPIRWASSRARKQELGHLEKARELYHEEIAVRESFSPAQANDWESRRELAGHYAELASLDRAAGRSG